MAYLVSQLITDAYYLSGIVSRQFEAPTGIQIDDGLTLLNDILGDKTVNSGLIPYTDRYTFNATPATSEYFIDNLIGVNVFTFYIGGVRYQTNNQQREEFFGSSRNVNVESLPFNWHFERQKGGGTLYLYFIPDTNYPMEIWGQFSLTDVTLSQDLSLTMDRFFINLIKYQLTDRLCQFNNYTTPANIEKQLAEYEKWISNSANTMDLRMQKMSTLTGQSAINYAIVNLSNGWLPY